MQERISWDEYFMLQAVALASRSTCQRLSVGAVLVRDRRLIASGYNGSVDGDAHCIDVGDLIVDGHCIRTIHAEQNALLQCAKYGVPVDGAEVYVTDFPCANCTKMLLQAGIKKINYLRNYHNDDFAMHLIELKGVELNKVIFSENSQDAVNLAKFIKHG